MKKSWDEAEIMAINYLKKNWYNLIETNFKFSIFWEVDLILKLEDLTIFVEVKYRSNEKFWTAEDAITPTKIRKLQKTIYFYCAKNNINLEKIRFDVITIKKETKSYKLIHYKNQPLN